MEEKKYKSSTFDLITICFLTCIGALSFYLYLNEKILIDFFFRNDNEGEIHYVASVESLKGNLRYKLRNDLLWTPVVAEDKLENHSEVFASADTNASIELNDGSTIDLSPHTHVIISLGRGQVKIKLVDGELKVSSEKNVSLSLANGTEIEAGKGKKLNVNFSAKNDSASFESDSGGVKVSHKGKDFLINTKENLKIDAKEVLKFSKEITLTKTPGSQAYFFDLFRGPIAFKDDKPGKKKYFLEVSRTRLFDRTVVRSPSSPMSQIDLKLKNSGNYYYRIAAYSGNKLVAVSDTKPVILTRLPAPNIIYPRDNTILGNNGEFVANIAGSCPNGSLVLEISEDTKFDQLRARPVQNGLVRGKVSKQTSFLRPKCVLQGGVSGYGQPIAIYKNARPKIQQPKEKPVELKPIELPMDVKEIEIEARFIEEKKSLQFHELILPNAYAKNKTQIRQEVKWPDVATASRYRVEVAAEKSFKAPMVKESDKASVTFTFTQPGTYFWRLSYFDKNAKQWSPPSQPGTIKIKAAELRFLTPANGEAKSKKKRFKVEWTKSKLYKDYFLRIEQPNGKVKEIPVKGNRFSLKMAKQGTYLLSLKAMKGDKVVANSDVVSVIYEKPKKAPPKPKPFINVITLTYPMGDVVSKKEGEYISFKWNAQQREPATMFVKLDGEVHQIEAQSGVTEKQIHLKPDSELEWWVKGTKSNAISSTTRVKVLGPDRLGFNTDLSFGRETYQTTNLAEASANEQKGLEVGDIRLEVTQNRVTLPTGCRPGGSFHYSLEGFIPYGMSIDCLYNLDEMAKFKIGPSIGTEALPYFEEKDGKSVKKDYQTYLLGARALYLGRLGNAIASNLSLEGLAGGDATSYRLNAKIIFDAMEIPLFLGFSHRAMSFGSGKLSGENLTSSSAYAGFSLRL